MGEKKCYEEIKSVSKKTLANQGRMFHKKLPPDIKYMLKSIASDDPAKLHTLEDKLKSTLDPIAVYHRPGTSTLRR